MSKQKMSALAMILRELRGGIIALSGGVDSLTLSCFAADLLGPENIQMIHAISPAVPESATRRVKAIAASRSWRLSIVSSGEFEDSRYRLNPVNRCFFCKSNLYQTLSKLSQGTVISGANMDDLSDYRPGLEAAKDYEVRHPYIEAEIKKSDIRQIARRIGLGNIAELPASPCLASRIETGIFIEAADLRKVNAVETYLAQLFNMKTVRCRIKQDQITIEIDADKLAHFTSNRRDELETDISLRFFAHEQRPVRIEAYKMGSAFVHSIGVPPLSEVKKNE